MAIITGTFNGASIIALPCDAVEHVTAPSSIEWDDREIVAVNESPFTGQTQIYDWGASYWSGRVSFPPMTRWSHDAWKAFLRACRGPVNVFLLGDPKARKPKGKALGAPVVDGANQNGYSLATRGWQPNTKGLLLYHDYIQIGNRLHSVTDVANADANGRVTLSIWPPLREKPADGASILTHNCKGLFRLANSSGNKDSVNVGNYGLSGFAIREAI